MREHFHEQLNDEKVCLYSTSVTLFYFILKVLQINRGSLPWSHKGMSTQAVYDMDREAHGTAEQGCGVMHLPILK